MFFLALAKALYGFVCVLTIILVLVQKGKGSMGLGNMGGANQMLFGGSGGQDIFQKVTRALGVILLVGSFVLSIWNARTVNRKVSFKKVQTSSQKSQ